MASLRRRRQLLVSRLSSPSLTPSTSASVRPIFWERAPHGPLRSATASAAARVDQLRPQGVGPTDGSPCSLPACVGGVDGGGRPNQYGRRPAERAPVRVLSLPGVWGCRAVGGRLWPTGASSSPDPHQESKQVCLLYSSILGAENRRIFSHITHIIRNLTKYRLYIKVTRKF